MHTDDVERVFGNGWLRMATGEHVEVFREAIEPGERRRYTKRFVETGDADFRQWTGREWRILARLIGHGVRCVPDVVRFDAGAEGGVRQLQTYDAGVTVDQWATLVPVSRDGLVLRHAFEDCAHWFALAFHCLRALDEIHALSLVHLDVKADNVCIPCGPDDFDPYRPGARLSIAFARLALIDFAFSLVSRETLSTALPLGWQKDFDYQSPRLLRALEAGRRGDLAPTQELDWRCDLYSLAAMMRRYLPDDGWASAEGTDAGWTKARYDLARSLVFRLRDSHDRDFPHWRPHRELMDLCAEPLAEADLASSLADGWTIAHDAAFGVPDSLGTPLTRIAQIAAPRRVTPVAPTARTPIVVPAVVRTPRAPRQEATIVESPASSSARPRRRLLAGAIAATAAAVTSIAALSIVGVPPLDALVDAISSRPRPPVTSSTPPATAIAAVDPESSTTATEPSEPASSTPSKAAASTTTDARAVETPGSPIEMPQSTTTTESAKADGPAVEKVVPSVAPALEARRHAALPSSANPSPKPLHGIGVPRAPAPKTTAKRAHENATAGASTRRAPGNEMSRAWSPSAPPTSANTPAVGSTSALAPAAAPTVAADDGAARSTRGAPLPQGHASPPAPSAPPQPSAPEEPARASTAATRPPPIADRPRVASSSASAWIRGRLALDDLLLALGLVKQRPVPVEERAVQPRPAPEPPASAKGGTAVARGVAQSTERPPEAAPTPPVVIGHYALAPDARPAAPAIPSPRDEPVASENELARARRLLAEAIPLAAAQAREDASEVLWLAALADRPGQNRAVVDAASTRWRSEYGTFAVGEDRVRGRRYHDDASLAFTSGRTSEALDLELRAFAAAPRDPDIAGALARIQLAASPAQAESARELALHALAMSGSRRTTRTDDWNTLAVASALTGRELDATRAFQVQLALTQDLDGTCRSAQRSFATYGERVRAPMFAMLYRVHAQGRAKEAASCEWPVYRTASNASGAFVPMPTAR